MRPKSLRTSPAESVPTDGAPDFLTRAEIVQQYKFLSYDALGRIPRSVLPCGKSGRNYIYQRSKVVELGLKIIEVGSLEALLNREADKSESAPRHRGRPRKPAVAS